MEFVMSDKKQNYGIIPAGTKVSIFGCGFTLKYDAEVLESQNAVNDEIAKRHTYESNGNLILSESLKNILDSKHP